MRLSEFIRQCSDEILGHSVRFARSLEPLANARVDVDVLRNHLPMILRAIASDLEQPQTRTEAITKSEGAATAGIGESAAQTHGQLRAESGLSVAQLVAEYRVLRAVVIRLWTDRETALPAQSFSDLIRFNEAIDQAIAESVDFHSAEVERWRNTLLAMISHDLRGPVQAISMTLITLSTAIAGDSPLAPVSDRMTRSVQRLGALLDTLLDYNRAQLGAGMKIVRSHVDLKESCRSELEMIRTGLPTNVQIDFFSEGSSAGVFDASRVREALANLVSNAVQYRTPGTPVQVFLTGESDAVQLSVVNEGPDIEPAMLQKFFQPLRHREHSSHGAMRSNLGIGLFIVREIARAHGGDAIAHTRGGKVVFSMRLPRSAVESHSPDMKAGAQPRTKTGVRV